jgi:hypothetical protein
MARALRVGVPGGMIAGVIMAVWSMIALWITGSGFWTPLNLIAHTFYRSAPLGAAFSAPATVIGLIVHMTVASIFGTAIAALAQQLPGARSLVIAGGIVLTAVVWPVMQYGIWYQIDESAAEGFTDWVFAVAHLIFGMVAASLAAVAIADDDTATRGRHAAGRTPSPGTRQPHPDAPGSLFEPRRRSR